jgi:hypothetical protein
MWAIPFPSDKSLGYYQASLRDEEVSRASKSSHYLGPEIK